MQRYIYLSSSQYVACNNPATARVQYLETRLLGLMSHLRFVRQDPRTSRVSNSISRAHFCLVLLGLAQSYSTSNSMYLTLYTHDLHNLAHGPFPQPFLAFERATKIFLNQNKGIQLIGCLTLRVHTSGFHSSHGGSPDELVLISPLSQNEETYPA